MNSDVPTKFIRYCYDFKKLVNFSLLNPHNHLSVAMEKNFQLSGADRETIQSLEYDLHVFSS